MAPISPAVEGLAAEQLPSLNPEPKLRIHFDDIVHPTTATFLALIDCSRILTNSTKNVLRHLYKQCDSPKIPAVRSVTFVLRAMDGVAYTTGLEIDDLHKEIHLNMNYVKRYEKEPLRCRDEIIGVCTHEMVHVWQHSCERTAPGGLIEGIADYVRLKSGLAPPHWKGAKNEIGEKWDDGYQKTAYFLDWLENTYGDGTIARMNQTMGQCKYEEDSFWTGLFGKEHTVKSLWKSYRDSFKEETLTAANTEDVTERDTRSMHRVDSEPVMIELSEARNVEA